MTRLLTYFAEHWTGILVLILVLFALALLANWLSWILGIGRFKGRGASPGTSGGIRYVITDFFVKIISEFRHLLALVIVSLFAVTLFLAMIPGLRASNVDTIKEGVQAVAAALGGLIGSIIGYYFGESAAAKRESQSPSLGLDAPVQTSPPGDVPEMTVAARPNIPAPPSGGAGGS